MILLHNKYWKVKRIQTKGRGIFAEKSILRGKVIGDYLGTVLHPKDVSVDEENFYLMYYHDYAVVSPNIESVGIHLLNHSCTPNVFLYIYKGHTLAFALRNIQSGEELTTSYQLAPRDKFCEPCRHICVCGSQSCRGTMHLEKDIYESWRGLTEKQAKETKKERIRYGKDLPKLQDYPEMVPNEYIVEVLKMINA